MHIHMAFKQSLNHQKVILHDIEASAVQSDIETYLRAKLKAIPRELDMERYLGEDWFTEEEFRAQVEKAGKFFIFVATALLSIADRIVCDPKARITTIIRPNALSGSNPYAAVDQLYSNVLGRALETQDLDFVLRRFRAVVGTIILLRDSLSLAEMERLLGAQRGYARAALQHLSSLIITPDSDDLPAKTYHQSFPDFIKDPTRCTLPCRIEVADQEAHLALRCLITMNTMLRRDIADLKSTTPLSLTEITDSKSKIEASVPAHLEYACCYWSSHLTGAKPGSPEVITELETFLTGHLLHWLEVLSLLGKTFIAGACAVAAENWANASNCSSTIRSLLHDANRFALGFAMEIASGPAQVYRSALPFCPFETALYRLYSPDLVDGLRVLGGVERQWSPCLSTLEGHVGTVLSLSFSLDGSRLASGSFDSTVRIWDVASGTCSATMEGHRGFVSTTSFSPDGSCLASGGQDKTVWIWDVASGTCIATHGGFSEAVQTINFSPNGSRLTLGSTNATIRTWNVASGICTVTLEGLPGPFWVHRFSPNGSRLALVSGDATVTMWDVASGACTATLKGHLGSVSSVRFSPDGSRLASGSDDRTVRIWDAAAGDCSATLRGHSGPVWDISFTSDGCRLASGSGDRTVRMWDLASGMCIATLEGHGQDVRTVNFAPDGSRLASGSGDYTVRLWDVAFLSHRATREGHLDDVSTVSFSPDGSRLASGSNDATVKMWDTTSGTCISTLRGHRGPVFSINFSPDGLYLASVSWDKTIVRIWEVASGIYVATLKGHSQIAHTITFSPDGSRLASGSKDATVRVWDVASATCSSALEGHSGTVKNITFSPNGSQLASGSEDTTVRVWDVAARTCVAKLQGHLNTISKISFSPDGARLASGSDDNTVKVWNLTSGGTCTATLTGWSLHLADMNFSSGGRELTAYSKTGHWITWDTVQGTRKADSDTFDHSTPSETQYERLAWMEGGDNSLLYIGYSRKDNICVCRVPGGPLILDIAIHGRRVVLSCQGGLLLILDVSSLL